MSKSTKKGHIKVRLLHPWSRYSQGQQTFSAPSADKSNRTHEARQCKTTLLLVEDDVKQLYLVLKV